MRVVRLPKNAKMILSNHLISSFYSTKRFSCSVKISVRSFEIVYDFSNITGLLRLVHQKLDSPKVPESSISFEISRYLNSTFSVITEFFPSIKLSSEDFTFVEEEHIDKSLTSILAQES